jgi:hypothetical protein
MTPATAMAMPTTRAGRIAFMARSKGAPPPVPGPTPTAKRSRRGDSSDRHRGTMRQPRHDGALSFAGAAFGAGLTTVSAFTVGVGESMRGAGPTYRPDPGGTFYRFVDYNTGEVTYAQKPYYMRFSEWADEMENFTYDPLLDARASFTLDTGEMGGRAVMFSEAADVGMFVELFGIMGMEAGLVMLANIVAEKMGKDAPPPLSKDDLLKYEDLKLATVQHYIKALRMFGLPEAQAEDYAILYYEIFNHRFSRLSLIDLFIEIGTIKTYDAPTNTAGVELFGSTVGLGPFEVTAARPRDMNIEGAQCMVMLRGSHNTGYGAVVAIFPGYGLPVTDLQAQLTQVGTASIPVVASSTGSAAVTFAEAFTSTPIVSATSGNDQCWATVSGVSTSGFTASVAGAAAFTATVPVQYLAVGL